MKNELTHTFDFNLLHPEIAVHLSDEGINKWYEDEIKFVNDFLNRDYIYDFEKKSGYLAGESIKIKKISIKSQQGKNKIAEYRILKRQLEKEYKAWKKYLKISVKINYFKKNNMKVRKYYLHPILEKENTKEVINCFYKDALSCCDYNINEMIKEKGIKADIGGIIKFIKINSKRGKEILKEKHDERLFIENEYINWKKNNNFII